MITHFPFMPEIRRDDQTVARELWGEIRKIAAFYSLDTRKMQASFELLPNPEDGGETHYLSSTVTYHAKVAPSKKVARGKKNTRRS